MTECVEEDWLSGREEGGGDGWDTPATCYLSREHACRVDAWGRVGCARGWGRQQGSPRLVHPPAELSSTTGPQGQGEGRGSSLSIHSLPSGPSSPFPTEEQPVASWALSFERLLQDPLGLAYFTVSLGWGKGRGDTGKGRAWMELQAGQSGVLLSAPSSSLPAAPSSSSPGWELFFLLPVLVSVSHFLSLPSDLAPSVWLAFPVWLGLLALSLSQSL